MAYDEKFRLRVIEYRDSGHTFKEVYEASGVDSKRYYCWKKQLDETGSVKFHAPKERDRKIDKAELTRLPDEHPDWYLREFAEVFGVWRRSVQKMFVKPGVTRKKTFTYSEKSAEKREEYLSQLAQIPKEDRVYVSD
jgi:transposase